MKVGSGAGGVDISAARCICDLAADVWVIILNCISKTECSCQTNC